MNFLTINPDHEPTDAYDESLGNYIKGLRLFQNFPNPFNSTTVIEYTLPEPNMGQIEIVNMSGQLIRVYTIDDQSKGNHRMIWDGKDQLGMDVTSGIYFFRLKAQSFMQTKKLILIR